MVNEYAMVNDPYNVQKGLNMIQLFEKKKMKLELKAKGLDIRQMDQCQKDEAIYMSTTDEELKRVIRLEFEGDDIEAMARGSRLGLGIRLIHDIIIDIERLYV
ncbi:hypothetical protein Tco_0441917 [Tanacetum coccineum]